jgi:hypothetical protein
MDQIVRMTQHLDEIEPREKTSMTDCLFDLAARMGRREIVMIFSDFFVDNLDDLEHAIQRLRYNKHEVVLFQTLHHDELVFEFDGMIKFIGLEVPDELLAQPDDLKRGYLAALNRFNHELEDIAQRNRCERILVDTRRPMAEALVDYLNRRSLIAIGR